MIKNIIFIIKFKKDKNKTNNHNIIDDIEIKN